MFNVAVEGSVMVRTKSFSLPTKFEIQNSDPEIPLTLILFNTLERDGFIHISFYELAVAKLVCVAFVTGRDFFFVLQRHQKF